MMRYRFFPFGMAALGGWLCCLAVSAKAPAAPVDLTCENLINPLAVDIEHPRLSWKLPAGGASGGERGFRQTAFQIIVGSGPEALARQQGDIWDSGRVASEASHLVPYGGPVLSSGRRLLWCVRYWDQQGRVSDYSQPAFWETGLLRPEDWCPAQWIRLASDTRQSPMRQRERVVEPPGKPARSTRVESYPAPMFRRDFIVTGDVSRARAYICALGYHELYINGARIGSQVLDPGQTTYDVRAFYVAHDITTALRGGNNAVGLYVGNGFFGQDIAFAARLGWGPPIALAKLVIEHKDGSRQEMVTDASWRAETGPVVFDNVYAGETYDARRERDGWALPGFDDTQWPSAVCVTSPVGRIEAQTIEPIERMRVLKPERVFKGANNKWIVDLGQNIAGWLKISARGRPGQVITMRFAETLSPDGTQIETQSTGHFATGFEQICIYVCKGDGVETWEPRFTYHGFRYVEIDGWEGTPAPENFEGVLVRSSVKKRGDFTSSHALIDRIYTTSMWTIEDNLHSTCEDCPHREKCGWLGDAHAVGETTLYNYRMAPFWRKFMDDIETVLGRGGVTYLGRKATPGIPCNIAVGRRLCQEARPDWGEAVVLLPWYVYLHDGDLDVIRRHYPLMKRWKEYVGAIATNGIVEEGYGDWCPPGSNAKMECPVPLTSTAYHYGGLRIMEKVARLLDKPADADGFAREAETTHKAFNERFLDTTNMTYGCQTANAIALRFGLEPAGRAEDIARALVRDVVVTHGGHYATGIHGTRPLLAALANHGFDHVAFGILTNTTYPSHGYMLQRGLTTWPETLVKWSADETLSRSLNHPMQSGFAAWFHETAGGIRPREDGPGFKRFDLKPHHFRQLAFVRVTLETPYGGILSSWKVADARFIWDVTVPPNSTAIAYVPALDANAVREGGRAATDSEGVKFLRMEKDRAVFELVSGTYRLESPLPAVSVNAVSVNQHGE